MDFTRFFINPNDCFSPSCIGPSWVRSQQCPESHPYGTNTWWVETIFVINKKSHKFHFLSYLLYTQPGKGPFWSRMAMGLHLERYPQRYKSGQSCLWKTSSRPCTPVSSFHTINVIQGNVKGWCSLGPVMMQIISMFEWTGATWNKMSCSRIQQTVLSKNRIHYLMIVEESRHKGIPEVNPVELISILLITSVSHR